MIKFSNQVPSVYPNASRDFQYLSWLMDIVLNSVKHNVDDIYDLPNNKADPKLTELLALTLGFKVKRNYDQRQLYALVAALPRIIKYKGTQKAIEMAGNALLAASGASGEFKSETNSDTAEVPKGEIRVTFPVGLIDISLFTDLLDYILPAGMSCHIVRKNELHRDPTTEITYEDVVLANWVPDLDHENSEGQILPGLANMFDVSISEYNSSNYRKEGIANVGLLDNNIIPSLPSKSTISNTVAESDYELKPADNDTTVIIGKYDTEENDSGTTVIIGG